MRMVHQKEWVPTQTTGNISEISPLSQICLCVRFELAHCNYCGCVGDPVDFAAFTTFSHKKYLSVFLEPYHSGKGNSSFISPISCKCFKSTSPLCLCLILDLMAYISREISFISFLRKCRWGWKILLTGAPSQEWWSFLHFSSIIIRRWQEYI